SLALLSVLALTLLALTRRPRDWRYGGPSLALLTLALGLSILGIFTPGSPAIGVLLGNLLTGLVMVALAWRLARHGGTLHASTEHGRLAVWLLIGATLWLTQAALGGVSGTGRFATATIAHAVFALGIALTAYLIGARAYRTGLRRDGMALIALVFTQFVLGVVTAVFGAALYLVLLHNFVAVVGLALIVGLVGRSQYNRVEMTTGTS
ncbi:MAG TPA: hypothetical protein P5528_12260, partial [Steroidobacteraceae bacterium]|nr:hypothetical protein [Steroidobacteraceae bacterium]